jgi:hypothetical protein
MKCLLTACRRAVLLSSLLIVATGCAQSVMQRSSSQEYLGMGIVSGTLGEQQCVALCAGEPSSTSVVGQVQALESGAYLIRNAHGEEIRVPHDVTIRIDQPAHVGDSIQSWFDHHGRRADPQSRWNGK